MKADEVKDAVEGVLLPLKVIGLTLRLLLIRLDETTLKREGEDGFA